MDHCGNRTHRVNSSGHIVDHSVDHSVDTMWTQCGSQCGHNVNHSVDVKGYWFVVRGRGFHLKRGGSCICFQLQVISCNHCCSLVSLSLQCVLRWPRRSHWVHDFISLVYFIFHFRLHCTTVWEVLSRGAAFPGASSVRFGTPISSVYPDAYPDAYSDVYPA